MSKKRIYLSGPMDGVTPEWATEWRKQVAKELPKCDTFDPCAGKDLYAYDVHDNAFTPEQIVEADCQEIADSDIVLVDWRRVPGFDKPLRVGTIMEMVYGKQASKLIVTFGTLRRGYWLRYHADYHFDQLSDAIEFLREWSRV